jgi:hypothetical protein
VWTGCVVFFPVAFVPPLFVGVFIIALYLISLSANENNHTGCSSSDHNSTGRRPANVLLLVKLLVPVSWVILVHPMIAFDKGSDLLSTWCNSYSGVLQCFSLSTR